MVCENFLLATAHLDELFGSLLQQNLWMAKGTVVLFHHANFTFSPSDMGGSPALGKPYTGCSKNRKNANNWYHHLLEYMKERMSFAVSSKAE